jgi:hypothetical protein
MDIPIGRGTKDRFTTPLPFPIIRGTVNLFQKKIDDNFIAFNK